MPSSLNIWIWQVAIYYDIYFIFFFRGLPFSEFFLLGFLLFFTIIISWGCRRDRRISKVLMRIAWLFISKRLQRLKCLTKWEWKDLYHENWRGFCGKWGCLTRWNCFVGHARTCGLHISNLVMIKTRFVRKWKMIPRMTFKVCCNANMEWLIFFTFYWVS